MGESIRGWKRREIKGKEERKRIWEMGGSTAVQRRREIKGEGRTRRGKMEGIIGV